MEIVAAGFFSMIQWPESGMMPSRTLPGLHSSRFRTVL